MRLIHTQRAGMPSGGGGVLKGFTLIELLVVMGLMVMIMGISVASWFGMRKGAEMRRSTSNVQSTIMLARQTAVMQRKTVTVHFEPAVMTVKVGNFTNHPPMYLSPGVSFLGMPADIQFTPSGRAAGVGSVSISLAGSSSTNVIDVWLLTGVTKVH